MSDQFIPKIEKSDVGRPGDASVGSRKRFKIGPIATALLIFILAFALRAGHNIGLKHQVWLLGDAYNYLFTGNLLLRTIQEPGKLQELISKGGNSSKPVPDHLKLASRDLGDRIGLDGLLYPSYLALAQGVAGVGRGTTMEESRLTVCLCNSFVDSVACVLVLLAATIVFGSTVGIAAGVMSAVYPPFVIGTQQCLSEPLACFCISLWLLALLRVVKLTGTSIRSDVASSSFLGIATAFAVMSKPAHVLLPLSALLMAAGFLCGRIILSKNQKVTEFDQRARQQHFKPLRFVSLSLVSIASAAIILVPSMLFTKAITGQWMVAAKRSPFENLALTFNVSQDGWYAYPYPGTVPNSTAEVLEHAKRAISEKNASELLLIGVKKVARLWSGVTNDYQFSVLGIGYDMQVFLHRLMLVFAFVGLLILFIRSRSVFFSRRALCGALLFLTISFHFIYLLFEAMPRYGLTAMPAVIILAAYGLVSAYRSAITPAYFFAPATILCASLLFLQVSREQCVAIAGLLGADFVYLAPWISGLLQSLVVFGIFQICVSLLVIGPATLRKVITVPNSSEQRWTTTPLLSWSCLAVTLAVSLVIFVCSVDRRDWTEWRCELKPDQSVKQIITMPQAQQKPHSALLMIDCTSNSLPPKILATVNGSEILEAPIPFAQVANGASSIVDGLMRAESVMGKDSRSFRQWWAIPLPVELLKYGSDNDVVLRTNSPDGVTIFGDFRNSDRSTRVDLIPSLWRFSYTKGYCSTERGDPRVMEEVAVQSDKVASSFYQGGNWSRDDLSTGWGAQSGVYRVRILTVGTADANQVDDGKPSNEPISLITGRTSEIDGKKPLTMFPLERQINLPPNLPAGSRFEFTCEVRSISATSDAVVSLVFGKDPGWSSQWQPKSIPIGAEWKRVSFSDTLPASVTANGEVRLVVYPYQSDLIYTNRKEALSSRVEVREASLKLLPATGTGLFQQSSQAQLF